MHMLMVFHRSWSLLVLLMFGCSMLHVISWTYLDTMLNLAAYLLVLAAIALFLKPYHWCCLAAYALLFLKLYELGQQLAWFVFDVWVCGCCMISHFICHAEHWYIFCFGLWDFCENSECMIIMNTVVFAWTCRYCYAASHAVNWCWFWWTWNSNPVAVVWFWLVDEHMILCYALLY